MVAACDTTPAFRSRIPTAFALTQRHIFTFVVAVLLSVLVVWTRSWILAWGAVEAVFWLWLERRWRLMSAVKHMPAQDCLHSRLELIYSLVDVLDLRAFLSGWFKGVPFEELRSENVKDFFAFGLWGKERKDMSAQEHKDLNGFVQEIQKRFGILFLKGYNSKVQHMAHLFEDLKVVYKPLCIHLLFEMPHLCTPVVLTLLGFRKFHASTFSYWGRSLTHGTHASVHSQKEAAARCTPCDAYPLLNVVERPTTILSVSSSSHSMHHQQQSTLSHRHSITHACTASTAAGGCRSMRLEDMKLQDLDMVDTDPSDSSEGSHSPTLSSPARESADSGAFTAFFPGSGPPTNQEAVPVGVVFLHGVGVGIFPYLAFLWKVLASFRQDTPFIVPQMNHVSQRLFADVQSTDEGRRELDTINAVQVVAEMAGVLKLHCIETAHFVGHSFGTFIVARMRHMHPQCVKSTLLCEPVCMVACTPQLVGRFVYHDHTPTSISRLLFSPSALAKWIVSRDLVLAQHFARNFHWHQVMMFPSQLPEVTVLCMSTHDEYVSMPFVEELLEQSDALCGAKGRMHEVIQSPGMHGAFLLSPKTQDRAIAALKEGIEACL